MKVQKKKRNPAPYKRADGYIKQRERMGKDTAQDVVAYRACI